MRALALCLVCTVLVGCPDSGSKESEPTAAVLQLDVDPGARKSRGPIVGETIQLRLSWGAGTTPKLLNTLVAKGKSPVSWTVEPASAVTIDASSSKARLNTTGEVTIWATYSHEGRPIRSNPLRLRIGKGSATVNKEPTQTSSKTSK